MSNDPRTFDQKLREIIIAEFKPGIDPFLVFETILSAMLFQCIQACTKFLPTQKMRKEKIAFVLSAAWAQWHAQNTPKPRIVTPTTPPNDNAQN